MKRPLLVIALLLTTHAQADEASKRAKIGQLAAAQGLEQMFQQQIDQSKAMVADLGKKTFDSLNDGTDTAKPNPELEKIFQRFIAKSGTMFTGKELTDMWTRNYSKQLTEAEVDQVLAYYRSPIGRKDIHATQAAMVGFSQTNMVEAKKRMTALLADLERDLKAAKKKQ